MNKALGFFTRRQFNLIVIMLSILTFCGTSKAQWSKVAMNDTTDYSQIIFVDSLRGYIVGTAGQNFNSQGVVYVTSDGGKSWIKNRVTGSVGLSSISAMGDSLVWVSSWLVYRSKDGGHTWQSDTVSNSFFSFLTVQFVDSLNGWVTGNYNDGLEGHDAIFHSTDAGAKWKQQYKDSADYSSYLGKGFFIDRLHGWVSDRYIVHNTTDGGNTWNAQGIGGSWISSVFFLDTLRGWAVGDEGFIGKTVDGGKDWLGSYVGPYLRQYTSVFFADTSNGWAAISSGGIIHTTDGGNSWIIQRSDTSGYPVINSLYILNKNNGWAVGNGIVLHTTNGGVTAIDNPSPQPSAFRLFQNYPNPFNPTTIIQYAIGNRQYVTLKIYDMLGREVASLVNANKQSGNYSISFNASNLASGVYFYKLTAGSFISIKKMLLVK